MVCSATVKLPTHIEEEPLLCGTHATRPNMQIATLVTWLSVSPQFRLYGRPRFGYVLTAARRPTKATAAAAQRSTLLITRPVRPRDIRYCLPSLHPDCELEEPICTRFRTVAGLVYAYGAPASTLYARSDTRIHIIYTI